MASSLMRPATAASGLAAHSGSQPHGVFLPFHQSNLRHLRSASTSQLGRALSFSRQTLAGALGTGHVCIRGSWNRAGYIKWSANGRSRHVCSGSVCGHAGFFNAPGDHECAAYFAEAHLQRVVCVLADAATHAAAFVRNDAAHHGAVNASMVLSILSRWWRRHELPSMAHRVAAHMHPVLLLISTETAWRIHLQVLFTCRRFAEDWHKKHVMHSNSTKACATVLLFRAQCS